MNFGRRYIYASFHLFLDSSNFPDDNEDNEEVKGEVPVPVPHPSALVVSSLSSEMNCLMRFFEHVCFVIIAVVHGHLTYLTGPLAS